jgi:pSer/pThr/pTyr-binding forkhead associated (FHA) protein
MLPSCQKDRTIFLEPDMPRLDLYVNYELQASFKLEGTDVVLGRDPKSAVQIPDQKVSRRHAVICMDEDNHTIENFSANGTKVNGRPIVARHRLQPGDTIFISSYILVYQCDDAPSDELDVTVIASPRN